MDEAHFLVIGFISAEENVYASRTVCVEQLVSRSEWCLSKAWNSDVYLGSLAQLLSCKLASVLFSYSGYFVHERFVLAYFFKIVSSSEYRENQ